jgi:hypothetical protein
VETTLSSWVTGDDMVHYSPGGLAWAQDWGSLRMTANAAFLAVVYAKEVARALPPPCARPEPRLLKRCAVPAVGHAVRVRVCSIFMLGRQHAHDHCQGGPCPRYMRCNPDSKLSVSGELQSCFLTIL